MIVVKHVKPKSDKQVLDKQPACQHDDKKSDLVLLKLLNRRNNLTTVYFKFVVTTIVTISQDHTTEVSCHVPPIKWAYIPGRDLHPAFTVALSRPEKWAQGKERDDFFLNYQTVQVVWPGVNIFEIHDMDNA